MVECPKCDSKNAVYEDYMGVQCIICSDCGYDECKELEVYPEEKVSQKAKAQHSPYRTGGPKGKR